MLGVQYIKITVLIIIIFLFGGTSMAGKPNRLIKETSPYLQEHAHNPVDWYPWGNEAFDKAKKEDKLVFLSIGYSSCHWCQVMEKEVFENESIAKLLNKDFVSIKVDREEMPDIDRVYMYSVQMMSGGGGWPLNVFLTPDKIPVFGGSYFPPESMGSVPSFPTILSSIQELYTDHRDVLLKNSEKVLQALKKIGHQSSVINLDKRLMETHYNELRLRYDPEHGGFGTAPKFPSPMHLKTLLIQEKRVKNDEALKMVTTTLRSMAKGGIMDQLAGGFHRYATDSAWRIPHFEKMITDQALLANIYLEGYKRTRETLFLEVTEKTLNYVLEEMVSPNGGFYTSQDADVDGVEGVYYVWKKSELTKILGDDTDNKIFSMRFGVTEKGNFEGGSNALFVQNDTKTISQKLGISKEAVLASLRTSTQKVLKARKKRFKLRTDTKIVTSYNALMISAFSNAFILTRNKKYLEAARKSADFILAKAFRENTLYRQVADNAQPGYLDDYAYMVEALLKLLEASGNWDYLYSALNIHEQMEKQFYDVKNGGFFYNPSNKAPPIIKSKFAYDESIPSPNAIAIYNYRVLYEITGKHRYKGIIKKSLSYFSTQVNQSPSACSRMLETLDLYWEGETQLVILHNNPKTTDDVIKKVTSNYIPHLFIYIVPKEEEQSERWGKIIISAGKFVMGGDGTFYLCTEKTCYPPTTDLQEVLKILNNISNQS